MNYTKKRSNFFVFLKRFILLVFLLLNILRCATDSRRNEFSPIEIKLVESDFAVMTNKQHIGNQIGYRFHEHGPLVYGLVPFSNENANINLEKISELEEQFRKKEGVFIYNCAIKEDEQWVKQDWSFYLNPVDDGVEILLIVKTYNIGLPEYYGIQSCFRLGGVTNSEWRKKVANTPAFSEYDLWASDSTKPSLTYVQRKGKWESIVGTTQKVRARTPMGETIDNLRTEGELESVRGPFYSKILDPIDNGLIIRTDISNTWVCGIGWEQVSHVMTHFPADCLHSIINIGNIPPYSKKAIRGKIYWFKGSKEDLFNHYKKESSGNENGGYYWGTYN